MTLSTMRKMVTLLACLPVAVLAEPEGDQSVAEQKLSQVVKAIPIQRVPTTPAQREAQRKQGLPVMTVKGQPGYMYRDFLQATMADTFGGVSSPTLKIPQENPDVYGCVTVSFEIRPDGKTDGFEVVKSESDPAGMFDEHALRAVFETEYEPAKGDAAGAAKAAEPAAAPDAAAAKPKRYERSIWFLVARPPRAAFSKVNEAVENSRNRRREELRVACEERAT